MFFALLLALPLAAASASGPAAQFCKSPKPGAPMFITATCDDPLLKAAVIDKDEQVGGPVPHRYVNGHFEGTGTRFSVYLPPADKFKGRFFQVTHQLLTSENAAPASIAFAIASGGFAVQGFAGPNEAIRSVADAMSGRDASVGGYRANAAAAKVGRALAAKMYGTSKIYGYLYGGSGGAYQVVSALQNTSGVWDGGIPFVMGSPHAIPNNFTVRIHALRVLKDKFPQIMDAIEPGGSGDPYAGLSDEEKGALREATLMGFPPRGWFDYPTMNGGPLALVAGYVPALDPTYVDDFWSKPGYLGSDRNDPIWKARIQAEANVLGVTTSGPLTQVRISNLPKGDLTGADLIILDGPAKGMRVPLVDLASLGLGAPQARAVPLSNPEAGANSTTPKEGMVSVLGFAADPKAVAALKEGVRVRVDNSLYLALQTYHRHQVPGPEFYGWDQYRGPGGKPLYPQRKVLIGPVGNLNGAGSLPDGTFHGKMILMENLMDIEALPWQADWYRKLLQKTGYIKNFRLYFTDHADHTGGPKGTRANELVDYQGTLQQLLRDLSAWVEQGVEPPAQTVYSVKDSQISVPATAAARKGIQPVVGLTVAGGKRIEVEVGQPVRFSATADAPPGTGKIVAAQWDFEGQGTFGEMVEPANLGKASVMFNATHSYTKPGTYFVALRVASERNGDAGTTFARPENLDRVRVVVK